MALADVARQGSHGGRHCDGAEIKRREGILLERFCRGSNDVCRVISVGRSARPPGSPLPLPLEIARWRENGEARRSGVPPASPPAIVTPNKKKDRTHFWFHLKTFFSHCLSHLSWASG